VGQPLDQVSVAILAGGFGTRLRSVVADRPKVLAPVHGRPFLTYLLDQLASQGIRQVVLLTGYQSVQVHEALGQCYAGLALSYSDEPAPLGTAGALANALPLLTTPTILLLNGDSYCAVRLEELCDFHSRDHCDLSVVLARVPDSARFGTVEAAAGGRVLGFAEKRSAGGPGWINAGIYLINRSLIEEIPRGRPSSLERDWFPRWVRQRRFCSLCTRAAFLDIGTPESYQQAETFLVPRRMQSCHS
jgi:D-glycero-alpha-D-manno-heptose 1-phosphate guanylyltransferase